MMPETKAYSDSFDPVTLTFDLSQLKHKYFHSNKVFAVV